ncbi:MAG: GNAT family N-acetyltransferase [Planctomycetaceae bacterium]
MIAYRCFRNDDPPRLADVWRAADLGPCGFQPMTSAWLEACVFSKPFFDREGLIVASDDDRVVGFAHAAFGPNADRSAIDTSAGTTMLVVVVPHERHDEIAAGLLARCEDYLVRRGAVTLYGGGTPRLGGCYLGLYGGADVPGILDSSPCMQGTFRRAGYLEAERIAVMRRALAGFRPPVSRHLIAVRRATTLRVIDEPARRTWWEAATTTGLALRRYELRDEAEALVGVGTFWDMQPLATSWGVHATGLMHVEVGGGHRRRGYANYLLAEAFHDLAQEGVAVAETHVSEANESAIKLFFRLGFEATAHGTVFRRP